VLELSLVGRLDAHLPSDRSAEIVSADFYSCSTAAVYEQGTLGNPQRKRPSGADSMTDTARAGEEAGLDHCTP
jgi:hypothetical protein